MIAQHKINLVNQFNDFINNQNLDGLSGLMTTDHTFIDSENNKIAGKYNCLKAWKEFFSSFPYYINVFTSTTENKNLIVITGYSVCSDKRLNGQAIWSAKIRNDKIAEWRVYKNSPETRKELNIH